MQNANVRPWRNPAKTVGFAAAAVLSGVDCSGIPQHHIDVAFSANCSLCEFCESAKPAQHYVITELLKRKSAGGAEWRKRNLLTARVVVKGNIKSSIY